MGVTFAAFEFKNCPFQLIFAKKYLSIWWCLGVDFDNFAPLLKMWFLYRKSLHVDMVSRFLTILRWLFSLILKLVSDFLTHCISHKVHAYFIRKIPYALENWPHGSKVIDLLAVNGWWWGNHLFATKCPIIEYKTRTAFMQHSPFIMLISVSILSPLILLLPINFHFVAFKSSNWFILKKFLNDFFRDKCSNV